MKLTMEDAEEFLTLPADALVQVSVASVETRDVPARDGKEGWTSLNFKFTVIGLPDHLMAKYAPLIGGPLYGSTGSKLSTHPDNKLRKWVEALLDVGDLEAGFELDTDQLVGHKARAQIGNYTKTGQTTLNHKVVGLLPYEVSASQNVPAYAGFSDEPPF